MLVVLLAVLVVLQVLQPATMWIGPAFAQQPLVGARGIYAFPVQLSPRTYGICMLDVDASTLWCYEYVPTTRKLRLAAARSWIFDRYLEEYNIEGLTPADVGRLVEKQRSRRLEGFPSGRPFEPLEAPSPQTRPGVGP